MRDIEILYNEYSKELYTYLLWLTHNESLSEDLLQETFLKAISSIKNFKGESSFKTWLSSIARHLWLQHLRKNNNDFLLLDLPELIIKNDIAIEVMSKDVVKRIFQLIENKDKTTKEVVLMRLDGYSYSEISNKVGISENSARVIDFRCKKTIKEILKKEDLL